MLPKLMCLGLRRRLQAQVNWLVGTSCFCLSFRQVKNPMDVSVQRGCVRSRLTSEEGSNPVVQMYCVNLTAAATPVAKAPQVA